MSSYDDRGILWGSPSMINQYIAAPDVFCAQRIFKRRMQFGAAAKRGQATEAGVVFVVARGETVASATEMAVDQFNRDTALGGDDRRDIERDHIAPMLEQAVNALKDYGEAEVPTGQQEKVTILCRTPEWSLPIIGYLDFRFPRVSKIVDLKTTMRMPPVMSAAHQRQRAVYSKATGEVVEFLYVTPKRAEFKADGDVDLLMAEIKTHLIRLEKFLRLDDDMIQAIVPVEPDSFYWTGSEAVRAELYNL
jgi:hypothetical protein